MDRSFWTVVVLGQVLSLCITGANVVTTLLSQDFGLAAPTTQTWLVYTCLAIVYNSYAIYQRGLNGWWDAFKHRGIYYFLLGWVDVEGNYFVIKSYQSTSMLSAMLLDCWSTPVCLFLSYWFLHARYRWIQYIGVLIAMGGLGMLVASDVITGRNKEGQDRIKGDLFCILGATLYGISNVGEEYMARTYPLDEVIGIFTLFASVINGIQSIVFEPDQVQALISQPDAVGLLMLYTVCMFTLYSLAPVMFRWGSAVLYNLSLLTSDAYGLIFGLFLFGYSVNILYPFAYVVIVLGTGLFHAFPASATNDKDQGKLLDNGV